MANTPGSADNDELSLRHHRTESHSHRRPERHQKTSEEESGGHFLFTPDQGVECCWMDGLRLEGGLEEPRELSRASGDQSGWSKVGKGTSGSSR